MTNLLEECINIFVDVLQLRERLGLSRDALAREVGVSVKTVYLWEKGKNRPSPLAQEKLDRLKKRGEKKSNK